MALFICDGLVLPDFARVHTFACGFQIYLIYRFISNILISTAGKNMCCNYVINSPHNVKVEYNVLSKPNRSNSTRIISLKKHRVLYSCLSISARNAFKLKMSVEMICNALHIFHNVSAEEGGGRL